MKRGFDKERELDTWCKLILDYTKERVENDSVATRWIFDTATHDEWVLSMFPKHLASVEAYNQFYELTGEDIRNFNWNSKARTKEGKSITVHKIFVDEHMTTAHDFKYELIYLYQKGELSVGKIKQLISKQRLCWITKEEDKKLNKNGFRNHRQNPIEAYKTCGIEIYDTNNENLDDIMKPTFSFVTSGEIFNNLQQYFDENLINGKKFKLSCKENTGHAWIYRKNGFMINVRVKRGFLKDICLFIEGDKAKERLKYIKSKKDEIEVRLGYSLVWDENIERKATRIGRFFVDAELNTEFELNNKDICFDFNIEDFDYVAKVANELINFYNVFIPIINDMN